METIQSSLQHKTRPQCSVFETLDVACASHSLSFLFFNFLFPFSLLFLLQLFPLSPPPFSSATCIFFSSSTFSSLSSWENKGGQYFLLSLVASLKYQSSPFYVYNLYTVTSVVFVDRQKQSCGQRILTRYGMYGLYCTMFVFAFPKSSLPLILG